MKLGDRQSYKAQCECECSVHCIKLLIIFNDYKFIFCICHRKLHYYFGEYNLFSYCIIIDKLSDCCISICTMNFDRNLHLHSLIRNVHLCSNIELAM